MGTAVVYIELLLYCLTAVYSLWIAESNNFTKEFTHSPVRKASEHEIPVSFAPKFLTGITIIVV